MISDLFRIARLAERKLPTRFAPQLAKRLGWLMLSAPSAVTDEFITELGER